MYTRTRVKTGRNIYTQIVQFRAWKQHCMRRRGKLYTLSPYQFVSSLPILPPAFPSLPSLSPFPSSSSRCWTTVAGTPLLQHYDLPSCRVCSLALCMYAGPSVHVLRTLFSRVHTSKLRCWCVRVNTFLRCYVALILACVSTTRTRH